MKNNKNLIIALVVVVVIAGGSFYGGSVYAKSHTTSGRGAFTGQFGGGQFAGRTATTTGARGGFGGATAGEILSSSNGTITVKLQDGNSKIVLVGANTQIMKMTNGSLSELATGTNVVVTGSANSDGSLTAQSIQIRPMGMTPGQQAQ